MAGAKELGIVLYVPALAVIQVHTVYANTDTLPSRLLDHPSVIHSVSAQMSSAWPRVWVTGGSSKLLNVGSDRMTRRPISLDS